MNKTLRGYWQFQVVVLTRVLTSQAFNILICGFLKKLLDTAEFIQCNNDVSANWATLNWGRLAGNDVTNRCDDLARHPLKFAIF
jgi:hypothetical protein